MDALTLEEINNSFPDNRYLLNVLHNPSLWQDINFTPLPNPHVVKFDENIKDNIPAEIKNKKGIYMFFLNPEHPFLPEIKHLVYVGRVRSGATGFNFLKRFDEYKKQIGNPNGSLNKVLLTNLWPNHTYVFFYGLDFSDEDIASIEDVIIKKIVPPLNSFIGGRTEQTRNLY